MNNFSLKGSLEKLKTKNYDINITTTIDYLVVKFDEEQLRILSRRQGLLIDNKLIRLYFIENIGFRCNNDKSDIFGSFPVCNLIEKFMNSLYIEFITTYN